MFKKRFEHLRANRRAISTLAIILIVIVVVASVVAGVVLLWWFGFWGQVVGSGNLATEDKDFTDFTIVDVGSGFEVEITQSSSYSISITADDNVIDNIETSKTGDTLTIHLKWGFIVRSTTLRAEIRMPDLYELKFSGGTHGTVEGFTSTHEFAVDLSGGSRLSGNFTTSGDAQFALSGGSHLTGLDGAANKLLISASGGSDLELSDFPVHDTTVNLSGGSSATINLDGRLDGDLSGGSHLKYVGNPTAVTTNTSGGSTIEKIG